MSDRRHVLVLNHFAAPLGEPGGTRHVELAANLQGWDATVVAADRNLLGGGRRRSEPPGFVVVATTPHRGNGIGRVASWAAFGAGAMWASRRLANPDVVVGSTPHLLAAEAGLRIARRHDVPFVLEVRDPWPEVLAGMHALSPTSATYRALFRLARRLEREAAAVVVLSEGVGELLRDRGVPAERVAFVPNGADPDALVAPAPAAVLRERYGFAPDQVVAVYAGAHGPANGLDLLLDAAAALHDRAPEVRIVLVGDGAAKPALQERAAASGLDNVAFFDPVPKQEVPALLGAADVGVHCLADSEVFRWGVSPNKLFDYLGAGLAVVTNTPGEVAAMVDESGAGVAVAPDGLADGLAALAAEGAERRRGRGTAGRAWLLEHRSRERLAARFEAVLDAVAS